MLWTVTTRLAKWYKHRPPNEPNLRLLLVNKRNTLTTELLSVTDDTVIKSLGEHLEVLNKQIAAVSSPTENDKFFVSLGTPVAAIFAAGIGLLTLLDNRHKDAVKDNQGDRSCKAFVTFSIPASTPVAPHWQLLAEPSSPHSSSSTASSTKHADTDPRTDRPAPFAGHM